MVSPLAAHLRFCLVFVNYTPPTVCVYMVRIIGYVKNL